LDSGRPIVVEWFCFLPLFVNFCWFQSSARDLHGDGYFCSVGIFVRFLRNWSWGMVFGCLVVGLWLGRAGWLLGVANASTWSPN
jgi:hypothetical protein